MSDNDDDIYNQDQDIQDTNDGWAEFLEHFKTHHYPVFAKYNVTFSSALMIWKFNQLDNIMSRIEELLKKDDWKKG